MTTQQEKAMNSKTYRDKYGANPRLNREDFKRLGIELISLGKSIVYWIVGEMEYFIRYLIDTNVIKPSEDKKKEEMMDSGSLNNMIDDGEEFPITNSKSNGRLNNGVMHEDKIIYDGVYDDKL